jgi:hypothetical protein
MLENGASSPKMLQVVRETDRRGDSKKNRENKHPKTIPDP